MISVERLTHYRLQQTTSRWTRTLRKDSSLVECKVYFMIFLTLSESNLFNSSSGATSMMAISHQWRDEELTPSLTGLYLSLPSPCIISALPEKYKSRIISWEQNKDAPVFNRASNDFSFRKWLGIQWTQELFSIFNTAPDDANLSFFL